MNPFGTFSFAQTGPGGTPLRTAARSVFAVYTTASRQPGWVVRLAAAAGAVTLLLVALVFIIPAVLVAVLVFALAAAYAAVRARIAGLRRPGGALDARRNVRVIPPPADR